MTAPEDSYDASLLPPRGSLRLERRGHDRAMRVDREVRDSFGTQPPERTIGSSRRLVVLCIAMIALDAVALVAGIVLAAEHPSFWLVNLGVLLVIVALVFRPRFGRPRGRELLSASAPLLFDLIDRVSTVARVPPPDRLVLDVGSDATWSRDGLRGVTTLRLGAQWWATLDPPLRVAQLARLLAGSLDPTRGQLIRPVLTMTERLVVSTNGHRTLAYLRRRNRPRGNIVLTVGQRLQWLVSRPLVPLFIALRSAALPTRLLADYVADQVAADVAGSRAAIGLADRWMYHEELDRVVYYAAAHRRPDAWAAAVDTWLAARTAQLVDDRAGSARTLSRWDARVPEGLRARVLAARPAVEARLRVEARPGDPMAAELAVWFDAMHAELLGAREFTARRSSSARP